MKKVFTSFLVMLLLVFVTFSQTVYGVSIIKVGSRGEEVRQMQQRLYELGYPVGSVDGVAGSKTIEAVVLFQKINDIEADGIAGPKTLNILFSGKNEPANTQPSANNPVNDSQENSETVLPVTSVLRIGSKGSPVMILQSRLNELGFSTGTPDGDFGPRTCGALINFQRANGLLADGIAGPATIKQMFNNPVINSLPVQNTEGTALSSIGAKIVAFAKQYLGTPYVYAANGPNSFDCSGFTCFVFKHFNVVLPRVVSDQRSAGYEVTKADLLPGDLVLFTGTSGSSIGHAGIYIGNGEFIHASSGSAMKVCIDSLNAAHYAARFIAARRIIH